MSKMGWQELAEAKKRTTGEELFEECYARQAMRRHLALQQNRLTD